jgi:hypothetical protein
MRTYRLSLFILLMGIALTVLMSAAGKLECDAW